MKAPFSQVICEASGRAWRDELVSLPRPEAIPVRVVDGAGREWPRQLAADALWTRVEFKTTGEKPR